MRFDGAAGASVVFNNPNNGKVRRFYGLSLHNMTYGEMQQVMVTMAFIRETCPAYKRKPY